MIAVLLAGFIASLNIFIGYQIGKSKGRGQSGFLLTFFLGPLGWFIMLLSKDIRPKCPECNNVALHNAAKCGYCNAILKEEKIETTIPFYAKVKEGIDEIRSNNNNDILLRGSIMTLAMRSSCDDDLQAYENQFGISLIEDIHSLDITDKKKKYALEPLYSKGWIVE
ncbi:MAG: hypothetical protein OCC49_10350 [Fibrobacterales bacterium]